MERPILFNTEMVRAILDGRKTQTRRIMKIVGESEIPGNPRISLRTPFNVGDILWVRETWNIDSEGGYRYKADDEIPDGWHEASWHPSIHMSKEAARIFLRVKGVRVEQLQDITLDDVHAEGVDVSYVRTTGGDYISGRIDHSAERFETLWDSTIKPADRDKYGWDANPWVWVIEFERIEKPETEATT